MSSRRWRRSLCGLLCAGGLLFGAVAQAGVTAERTRVIFPAGASETSLRLVNLNGYPVMVQTWIDNGALDSTPDKAVAPIMPLPPMFRMLPAEHQTLRLVFTGDALPADRESLYWLNIYEVPPSDSGKMTSPEQPRVLVTMRTQMKVFYRPKNLPVSPDQAVSQLRFGLRKDAAGEQLHVDNPTPYYFTLTTVGLGNGPSPLAIPGGLVPPFAGLDLPVDPRAQPAAVNGKVRFVWLDDDGNAQTGQAQLQ
ncbi:fimbrial biogenesis chaperone [Dyella soli]|uniref:Molecular chaperone n=1 Tax=Dyella soli TaxID=522319 RepID=A0A4R0YMF2_9GAMM|nr:molecular chaperone [Dyella soli]TCI06717.1 molecular chaperone [Dyella soli]